MTRNISISSIDKRNLKQILYEKSVFGAAPTHYTLAGDDDWHPIQFVDNKRLQQIQFSDGTTIHVQGETNQTLATLNEIFRERNDANTLDGLEADLESAMTEDLTAESDRTKDYVDERAHFRGVGGAAQPDYNPDVYDSYSARYQRRELTHAEIDAIARTAPTSFEHPQRGPDMQFGDVDSTVEDDPDPVPSAESAETVPTATADDPISDFLRKQHINPNPFGGKE